MPFRADEGSPNFRCAGPRPSPALRAPSPLTGRGKAVRHPTSPAVGHPPLYGEGWGGVSPTRELHSRLAVPDVGSATSGSPIDQALMVIVFGIVPGAPVQIGRSVAASPPFFSPQGEKLPFRADAASPNFRCAGPHPSPALRAPSPLTGRGKARLGLATSPSPKRLSGNCPRSPLLPLREKVARPRRMRGIEQLRRGGSHGSDSRTCEKCMLHCGLAFQDMAEDSHPPAKGDADSWLFMTLLLRTNLTNCRMKMVGAHSPCLSVPHNQG